MVDKNARQVCKAVRRASGAQINLFLSVKAYALSQITTRYDLNMDSFQPEQNDRPYSDRYFRENGNDSCVNGREQSGFFTTTKS